MTIHMEMEYDRLHPTPSARATDPDPPGPTPRRRPRATRIRLLMALAGILLVAAAAVVAVRNLEHGRQSSERPRRGLTTGAITKACGVTRFPELCMQTLVEYPVAGEDTAELARVSVNMTRQRFGQALSESTEIGNWEMDTLTRSAYLDCLELLEDSVDLLGKCLSCASPEEHTSAATNGAKQVESIEDVMTWLSGAMTNHDTCTEGLNYADGNVKNQMGQSLQNLSELISNCLAIYAATNHVSDFSGVPIQNRRLLESKPESEPEFPKWISRSERELLAAPTQSVQADIIVAQDGSGTVKTIAEAIENAPQYSPRRIIIHVKAGTYAEANLKVGRKKTNLWFLGEGKGRTVITGLKSVARDNITTFHTASFAATGTGFLARDITFVNEAGPQSHQAVALRVGADHAVIYRCEVKGYQDTLYVHSQRQFFRECDIYGTVDFIFGNAAVVFQHCNMWAQKPMYLQKNTITAQNRKDPNQNTGMSFHACQARATSDLEPVKSSYPTFLGRPWKMYARVVYMESYLGDHIDPKGWEQWDPISPLDKLYYGEYGNVGPRADTSQRVKWPSLHVNMSKAEAQTFTVAQFIFGQAWITSTGVAYQAGLST